MEIFFTKDKEWLAKWDDYVLNENKGSHLLLSDWNKSFQSYGFDFEIAICLHDDKICGGFTSVIAKALVFKFYIVPFGPIVSLGFEMYLNELISSVQARAKFYHCCYCHISLPLTKNENLHAFLDDKKSSLLLQNATNGHLFKYVYSAYGINWIDLKGHHEESKIMSLKPSVRRNIRNAYRKDLVFKILSSEVEIENGYSLFVENAKMANYSIRDWTEMRQTLFELNRKGFLKMLAAIKNNELKGVILLVKAGNYYTYILGGSKKEVPDLRTGDFLQWETIKLSLKEGLDGYNISLGGSKGVEEFKNSFNTEQFYFENGHYHWVLKPAYFKIYLALEKHLKTHKKTISKLLSKFKG
jgi:lipid II:glycine glycyltransferase (peptidoglycan interpeptide bridge formation enzyme)